MKTFTFYSDAGHGWLEVSLADLEDVGLTLQEFSPYSYRSGDTLFLEEDCDAGVFIKQYKSRIGEFSYKERDHGDRSGIRDLDRLPAAQTNDIWF